MSTLPDPVTGRARAVGGTVGSPPAEESRLASEVLTELGRVVVGQRALLERLLIGLLADGHVLLEGVPGLAKTLAVRTLAAIVSRGFHRIQFTPDLLPADLIGTQIYNQRSGDFTVAEGADLHQRAAGRRDQPRPRQSAERPARSDAGEAGDDRRTDLPLPDLFLVLATQNPIEHEGTYPLPEAQVDRFMFKLVVTYPDRPEEREVLDRMTAGPEPTASPVLDAARVLHARRLVQAGLRRRPGEGIRSGRDRCDPRARLWA